MRDTGSETRLTFFGSAYENADLADEITRRSIDVLTSGQILNGPEVSALEGRVAGQVGRAHAVAVNSATDGLYFAMLALGLSPGDEVLTTGFSFVASASGILRLGARPVFVDVERDGPEAPPRMCLKEAQARLTSRTRAIIWVDLFGGLSDPDPVREFADTHGLALIEDASQAYGATYGDRRAGQLGDVAVFSFDRNKVVGADGTAGMVLTSEDAIAATLRKLRYHGVGRNGFERLGFNSQMSGVTASLLDLKLDHHARWVARRHRIAAAYSAAFAGLPAAPVRWTEDVGHVWHKYVLLCPDRSGLEAHLKACEVPCRRHYSTTLPNEPLFAAAQVALPKAEKIAATALSLPMHAYLSDEDVAQVIGAVRGFYGA